jgi:protein Tex
MDQPYTHHISIAADLGLTFGQVQQTVRLLEEGASLPFIARYRKEATGSLDEVFIARIRDQLTTLIELDRRRSAILDSLEKRDLLTEELAKQLRAATNPTTLEDLYLPFRPKRRTRGMIAKEKGLSDLAVAIFSHKDVRPELFIDPEHGIPTEADAFAGARDIIAEWISEDSETRIALRRIFSTRAIVVSKAVKKKEAQAGKYRDYFNWQEEAVKAPGHRLLAMFRGENEKLLTISLRPPEKEPLRYLHNRYVTKSRHARQMSLAVDDCYHRLLAPSLENELHRELKEAADKEAIDVFAANIRELLLAPPLGAKRVLALDPGFRTGAKLACLDEQGKLLHHQTIYPTHGGEKAANASRIITELVQKFGIDAIAIGNGTASRETEDFIRSLELGDDLLVTLVNEDGASIYSASESARAEFPDLDLTIRGAISIGRRLQDPLAELVKIDPKSIGVGQYQHDVNQSELKKALDDVVISCVNSVGVELNNASLELLTHVSGLGPALAKNIIDYRDRKGPFTSRTELLQVPRLGAKAFEQCAGFLRIRNGVHPLDGSGVHPEMYPTIEKMAKDAQCSLNDLIGSDEARKRIDLKKYMTGTVGMPTLTDIMTELAKPGRDPRKTFTPFSFAKNVHTIHDLQPGMKLPGIVSNITKFGAFVDIGVHLDGLIHISQLADRYVRDPNEIVKIRQRLKVTILEVDKDRGRISLSLKEKDPNRPETKTRES